LACATGCEKRGDHEKGMARGRHGKKEKPVRKIGGQKEMGVKAGE
jgi:hypothetical protein